MLISLIKKVIIKNYLLKKNYKKIFFTSNPSDLKKCNIIFIAEDVKTNKQGISDLTQVKKLITLVKKHANSKAISVMLSQIPPKFTRKHFFNKERVFYQVETLIFGQAISRALKPERFIIGCLRPEKELPIEYKKLAQQNGCDKYTRIPALGINDAFIESLFNLVINKNENQFNNKIFTPKNKCPSNFEKCFCLK